MDLITFQFMVWLILIIVYLIYLYTLIPGEIKLVEIIAFFLAFVPMLFCVDSIKLGTLSGIKVPLVVCVLSNILLLAMLLRRAFWAKIKFYCIYLIKDDEV